MSDIAGHSPDEHWDKKGSRMEPPNYEVDLASAFPLRYDSPAIRPTPPQGGSAISHEHLWRVVIGEGTSIRWCERCSKSYKLMGERSTVKWIEINE